MIDKDQTKGQQIVDFLNELLQHEPDVRRLFDAGVPCGDYVLKHSILNARETVEGNYVTVAGIIYAIGVLIGEPIVSKWDIDDGKNDFVGFALQSEGELTQGDR